MTAVALTPVAAVEALPAVLARAAATLAGATDAAAVLEAREQAGAVYDAARRAERLAAAVNAHDDLVERARRMQADALLIELRAKTRLADEYDAAQARGELASPGRPKNARDAGDLPGAAPAGVDTRRMAEYRRLRDAVAARPGVVERAVTALLDEGDQITRAAIWRAVDPHADHRFEAHPLAQLFPPMSEAELAALANDIAQHGQRMPVVLLGGKVLDGRQRILACKRAGIEPRTRDFNPDTEGDPLRYVLSMNVMRSSLTESQRAMVAARMSTPREGVHP